MKRRRRQGTNDKVVSLVRHRRFKHLAKVAATDVKAGTPRKNASPSRMVAFAHRIEHSLTASNALPTRSGDRTIVGDLADLEWRTAVLWRAIHEFARVRRKNPPPDEFDARLMMLFSSVDAVGDVIRDLRGPLTRLLRTRCGYEGLALAALAGASGTLQGRYKPKGRTT